MENRINVRVKNEDTKIKVEKLLKEKNISCNQFINELLDDYFLKNEDKSYLKNISDKLDSYDKRLNKIEVVLPSMALTISRCLTLLLNENTKNVIEIENNGEYPNDYYSGISDYSLSILECQNSFIKDLANYISNYYKGDDEDEK